jgi:hypothetical protein
MVHYRVGIEGGAPGGKFKSSVDYFRETVLLGWAVSERGLVVVRESDAGGGKTSYTVVDVRDNRLYSRPDSGLPWTDRAEAVRAAEILESYAPGEMVRGSTAETPPARSACGSFTIHNRKDVIAPDDQPTLVTICSCNRMYAWGHYLDSDRFHRWLIDHDADVACPHRPSMQVARDGGTYCADCGVTR